MAIERTINSDRHVIRSAKVSEILLNANSLAKISKFLTCLSLFKGHFKALDFSRKIGLV